MIKEVQIVDINTLLTLQVELWPMHTVDELLPDCRKALQDPKQISWIYYKNSNPIGFLDLSIKDKALGCKSNKIGYVEGWYVKPEYQGNGFGLALYNQAELWAIENGCFEMASDTTQDYPLSIHAHEKVGFSISRRATHFKKDID
ncbi:MAG: GNAT family N-acetyltransferase [Candidatus Marinimicrobia bacterium]|nr:GNAT family N-acetyltransferase [Candidatus Neomarinimicrobiota bacterium]